MLFSWNVIITPRKMSVWELESQVYRGKDCKVTLIAVQPKPHCIAHAVWKIFKSSVNYPFCCWSIQYSFNGNGATHVHWRRYTLAAGDLLAFNSCFHFKPWLKMVLVHKSEVQIWTVLNSGISVVGKVLAEIQPQEHRMCVDFLVLLSRSWTT